MPGSGGRQILIEKEHQFENSGNEVIYTNSSILQVKRVQCKKISA
jgi:hypothetical protein